MTSIECRIMAADFESSLNSGITAVVAGEEVGCIGY